MYNYQKHMVTKYAQS